jgi:hypothetical protein
VRRARSMYGMFFCTSMCMHQARRPQFCNFPSAVYTNPRPKYYNEASLHGHLFCCTFAPSSSIVKTSHASMPRTTQPTRPKNCRHTRRLGSKIAPHMPRTMRLREAIAAEHNLSKNPLPCRGKRKTSARPLTLPRMLALANSVAGATTACSSMHKRITLFLRCTSIDSVAPNRAVGAPR